MANIKVLGDTVQICSALTMEIIEKTKRYNPDALVLVDNNNEPYFAIGIGDAHYGKHGITFSSKDVDGYAFMTTNNPIVNDHTDREAERQAITDRFAMLLNCLNRVESQIITTSASINELENNVQRSIEFVGDIDGMDCELTKCEAIPVTTECGDTSDSPERSNNEND